MDHDDDWVEVWGPIIGFFVGLVVFIAVVVGCFLYSQTFVGDNNGSGQCAQISSGC